MKKVDISNLRKELERISDSDSKKTIIINNAELYNDLIAAYKKEKEQHNIYIIYQLNGMIIKQIAELEKAVAAKNTDKADDTPEYPMNKFMQNINQKFETR
jgi:hypothetical protein